MAACGSNEAVRLPFDETKTTQAAARLLKLRGGRMSYMKLIKLLYLVDREALLRWGRPLTGDRYVSMDKGPVVSGTLDLINEGDAKRIWSEYISAPEGYEVSLLRDAPADELSAAEEELIEEIFRLHGHKSRWELVDLMHSLPEWENPNGSAIPIEYHDILIRSGKTELEARAIEEELESLAAVQALLGPQ